MLAIISSGKSNDSKSGGVVGIVRAVIFPSNHQEKKYLAEELIHNEILSLQDIALLGVNDNDSE